MTMWTPDLQGRRGPRYVAIAEALADAAASGRLRSGARLPTHRELAGRLGVTVGTVTRAYAEAARRGVVAGEVGRGTFVRGTGGALLPPLRVKETTDVVDLTSNLPPHDSVDEGGPLARTLARLARRKDLARLLAYPPEGGALPHREAGSQWIRRSGLTAPPEQVLVSSGIQHGMTAVFAALLGPGDVVLTEEVTYAGMKTLASLLSLRLQGIAMDEHGLRPDALAAACRGTRSPKALYCLPTLQNPTTAVMPEERRREIAFVAREHGLLIIEDDVHGRLPDRALRPLSAHAPEASVYLTGTSKVLAPGLRVAFIFAPPPLVPRLAAAIRGTTWMAAPLMAEIAATWIHDGTAEAILKRRRREAAARHRLAMRVLEGLPSQSHPSAYHLWLHLPPGWRSEPFAEAARARGVGVMPATAFAVGRGAPPEAVRISLGAAHGRPDLERGLGILASLLRAAPERAAPPTGP